MLRQHSNEDIKVQIYSGNKFLFAMRTLMQSKTVSTVSKLKV